MKRVTLHVLFWIVYLAQDTAFAYLADAGILHDYPVYARIGSALGLCVGFLLPKIILTYFLLNVMLERIIRQREKIIANTLIVLLAFAVTLVCYRALAVYILYPEFYHGLRTTNAFFSGASWLFALMDLGFVTGVAIAIKLICLQFDAKEKEKQLIRDKLETEIKFLKNQTNPHFLFNTLNNIYALARKKSELAPDAVLKLSKMLRFMLYETGKEQITIAEEVTLIENYIDLEKLRYDERLKIATDIQIDDPNQKVSPLLLLPFIENAFKHGASETRFHSFINISLRVLDGALRIEIENNKNGCKNRDNGNGQSIGFENIRRQLELLYADYDLAVENSEQIFKVILNVNLKSHGKI